MKNTTGLYKRQRDNQGKRRRIKSYPPAQRLIRPDQYGPQAICNVCGNEINSAGHYILCEEKP